MNKKTIKIFIIVFILTGIIILGVYLWINKNKGGETTTEAPWYQNFNPFGTGNDNNPLENPNNENPENPNVINPETIVSKFYQITDFAVAGATFLEDQRLKENEAEIIVPKETKIIISVLTKEGRKEIQQFLNTSLSLNPALVVDGVFGKKVTKAIEDFQKQNNLTITGKIDTETAPYFTKTSTTPTLETSLYEVAPSVRYVERANGHIYKMLLDTKNKEKISNSTIPGIYDAIFDNTGKTIVYRYLSGDNVINSFMATLGAPKGEFLPQGIYELSSSINKDKFFSLTKNGDGASGSIESFGNTNRENVFTSPFTEWLSEWDGAGNIFLTTKPSYLFNGTMFTLNPLKKTLNKVLDKIPGLTTKINHAGSLVLYSASTNKGPTLGIFDIREHTTKDLGILGLSEKCVWSDDDINIYCALPNTITGNQYPDSWYQGLVSFDDFFVKINTTNGNKITIANSIKEIPVDATSLFLDKEGDYLFFINKKDSTLWSLEVK